jgi:hypothetical protein
MTAGGMSATIVQRYSKHASEGLDVCQGSRGELAKDDYPEMAREHRIAAVCGVALLVLSLASANGAASRGPVSITALAPADEYFGRLKLSPFGIRHKIFALKDDLHHARFHPDSIQHDALLIEDALRDWFTRYPDDPWLPATAWNLATLYEELPGSDAQSRAVAALRFVHDSFSDTPYAQYAAKDLGRGVGVRPWPHWAGSPPSVATQSPSTQSPAPTGSPVSTSTPFVVETPNDPKSLVAAILAQSEAGGAQTLEKRYWTLSKNGTDGTYARAAWELAVLYEKLPGEDSRKRAIRFLSLLVDRYSNLVYGRWALRDLERGVGAR